ncbi:MAG: DNA methylase [Lachnospiraceae bacterium]|nr:DNA methylase [Lachnospiraceae bacterium]
MKTVNDQGELSDNRIYAAIDLKSFYASVECHERELDPFKTNLVVADPTRTDKTICLAVSPALKTYGIPGRIRLFEVKQTVAHANAARLKSAGITEFTGSSDDLDKLNEDPTLELSFVIAPPRMSLYMQYSTDIYKVYLKYFSHEDIHVYSCDEVFIDMTHYIPTYKLSPKELVSKILKDIYKKVGITATAGIGTNMFLAKIAMDIWAKHIPADVNGVRIAELDEMSYRHNLWTHTPLTDFWRVGRGTVRRLAEYGMYTMGDIAVCSERDEELLYRLFGVNAELLIDHAWGYEPCTIADIKSYNPKASSTGSGQVLMRPYKHDEAAIIVREMADTLSLDLVDKGLVADSITLYIGYDGSSLDDPDVKRSYKGEITVDYYGRPAPKAAHGTASLSRYTASTRLICEAAVNLFESITDPILTVRRVNITANNTVFEDDAPKSNTYEQLDLFTDYEALEANRAAEDMKLDKEKALQKATLELKKRFGKNAVIKGTDLQEGAMTIERNNQIGGHKA